jgi:hypothetical protein
MSFTPLDGYAIVADLRCGDNALDGVPELGLESSSNEQVTADNVWDADPSDGFDSGWVNVEVDWNANGEIDFNVNGTVISYNGGPYDDFYGFVLRSGVSAADSTVAFRNVSAQFFHSVNGIDLAQVGVTDDAVATTAGNAQPDAESIVVTVPNGGGIKSARLFAQVRMQSPDLPNPTDLFGQIFIYAAPHS